MSAQHGLIPAMVEGTSIGGLEAEATCDSCNRRLTDGHREHDPDDTEADTVYAYATRVRGTNEWSVRWVSCDKCGPLGDVADEPGKAIVKATISYEGFTDGFALSNPRFPA